MTMIKMIVKELWHRKVNFLLAVLAVMTAVTFFVAFSTAARGSERETARLMLSMGYNLHIVAKEADVGTFLMTGIADQTMPQAHLDTLASQREISYNHLLATLERKIEWRGMEVLLTGLAPEVCPPGSKKPAMVVEIEPGTAYLGHHIASVLDIHKGDTIVVSGKELKVERCLQEAGGLEDVRLQCCLSDAQAILDLPGQISEIQAVDCLCYLEGGDPVEILRRQIGAFLPETQVVQVKAIASARAKQRQMIRKIFRVMLPFVVIACGVWIGVLAITNVRDRQQEIGLLRALGYGSGSIILLFVGKALLVGLSGAIAGFFLGTLLGLEFGPDIFKITAQTVLRPERSLLVYACVLAPLFAMVASFIPTMIGAAYDPATTLREE